MSPVKADVLISSGTREIKLSKAYLFLKTGFFSIVNNKLFYYLQHSLIKTLLHINRAGVTDRITQSINQSINQSVNQFICIITWNQVALLIQARNDKFKTKYKDKMN